MAKLRTVADDALAEPKLAVRPAPLILDAAPGREQRVTVSFENRGNTPLTIDLAGAYPLGEEVTIDPDRLEETDAGETKLAALFDRLAGRGRKPRLVPAGNVDLALPDGPEQLAPGDLRMAQVRVTLPEGLSPTARYHVFAPLYGADLHIVIVTAAKSPAPAKPARKAKGAAA